VTDKYLKRLETTTLVSGLDTEMPSIIKQDNVDKLVEGFLNSRHRQYEFQAHWDLVNAEAFKYGMGIGRIRNVTKPIFIKEARGLLSEKRTFPAFLPRSIKHCYLDDNPAMVMNEGHALGGAMIFESDNVLTDLIIAANLGSNDPEDENGGWMPKNLKGIEADNDGNVQLLEYEGDMVLPRKTTRPLVLHGVIVTVICSKGKANNRAIIRLRFRKHPFSSYIEVPYHREHIDNPYAASPLMKGYPIQLAATEALNGLIDSGVLNIAPPIQYETDDPNFSANGGPDITPFAKIATLGRVEPIQIGDPNSMFAIYGGLIAQYADVTGINAARLGAQTVSHTTAFAKEAELRRGTVRTVDYVRSTLKGPMEQFLQAEYIMGREALGGSKEVIYIDQYRGFVNIEKASLPERVVFEAHGAGGPAEQSEKNRIRATSLQFALSIDQARQQAGLTPHVNTEAAIDQILREGGWIDIDELTNPTPDPSGGGVDQLAAASQLQRTSGVSSPATFASPAQAVG